MIRRGAAKRRLRAQAEETNWPVLFVAVRLFRLGPQPEPALQAGRAECSVFLCVTL